jgi:hypothetical protein
MSAVPAAHTAPLPHPLPHPMPLPGPLPKPSAKPIDHPVPVPPARDMKVTVDGEGCLVLPNGKKYTVSRLVLKGETIDLKNKLSDQQLKEIAALVESVLIQKPLTDKDKDLKELSIKIDHSEKTAKITKKMAAIEGAPAGTPEPAEIVHAEIDKSKFDDFYSKISKQYDSMQTVFASTIATQKEDKAKKELEAKKELDTKKEAETKKKATSKDPEKFPKTYRLDGEALEAAKHRKFIHNSFIDPDTKEDFGVELVERHSTVEIASQNATAALARLMIQRTALETSLREAGDKRGKNDPILAAEIKVKLDKCVVEIQHHERTQRNCKKFSEHQDWLDCNFWRHSLHDHADFDQAVEDYIPAPINMRYHSVRTPLAEADRDKTIDLAKADELGKIKGSSKEIMGLTRMSVITDERNGWYGVAFLNSLKGLDAAAQKNKLNQQFEAILKNAPKELKAALVTAKSMDTFKKALDGLVKKYEDEGTFDALKLKLKVQSAGYALERLLKIMLDPTQLEAVIHERQLVLEDNMLQLVATQVQKQPEQIGSIFKMAHVALLNGHRRLLDESGSMHDEEVILADMSSLFADFDGACIKFGDKTNPVTHPYIDSSTSPKTIYLPSPNERLSGKTVYLETFFMNISPQKNTKNDGLQKELNKKAIAKLRSSPNTVGPEFKPILDVLGNLDTGNTHGGFNSAEDLVAALNQTGKFAVSLGCAGAKDRGGVVAARASQRSLEAHNPKLQGDNPFESQIFDADKPAGKIAYENTGITTLKVPHIGMRGVGFCKAVGPDIKSLWYNTWGNPHENAWRSQRKEELAEKLKARHATVIKRKPKVKKEPEVKPPEKKPESAVLTPPAAS